MKVERSDFTPVRAGSLQQKGKWFYLVCRIDGRQKWRALHTTHRQTALRRARELCCGRRDVDERAWLLAMVRQGEEARCRLSYLETCEQVTWENLWPAFLFRIAPARVPPSGEVSYRRWLTVLAAHAVESAASTPVSLGADAAKRITASLCARYAAVGRMVRFFRRVWASLGLDASIWAQAPRALRPPKRFRRLSVGEVRSIRAWLLARRHRDLADILEIGYYTGLRLSDICELEFSEVAEDRRFLSLVPNKVRERKRLPLLIPLAGPAQAIVRRRLPRAPGPLFPRLPAPGVVSKRFRYAFRSVGVGSNGIGRASFHSLRATFISLMDDAGVPPYLTDSITGHGGGTLHARYTQPSRQALAAAVRRALPRL